MKCAKCEHLMDRDDLDSDGLCFECATFDPDFPTEQSKFDTPMKEILSLNLGVAQNQSSGSKAKN